MKPVTVAAIIAAGLVLTAETAAAQVEFKDHRGKEIVLDAPPQKVVTIVRSGPILYRAVDGSADHIAAVNQSFFKRDYVAGLYGELLPELGTLTPTAAIEGFVPNIEAILEIAPDAVIQWASEGAEPLERVGLNVIIWDCCTAEQRRDYVTLTGHLTGKEAHAKAILDLQDASAATMRETFAAMPDADKVSALYIDQFGDQIRIIANGSLDLSLSGVTNPAADDTGQWWQTIDLEQLFAWNPDMILIPPYAHDLTPASFYGNALLADLDAVKNRRVYKIPAFAGSPDAPEIFLSSPWLAAVAHGADTVPQLRGEIHDAYAAIYGIDLGAAQMDSVLYMDQNAASDGYSAIFR
ncbi:ABC transporter substrate-binding protein [Acuticoccus mangrovi]|uniref:ABC transporter substrate-binding protein n=1 Tax=Acuticoccus mangrovi TaxID=2796142 RepID=A0A934IUJ1_9HYPH|nr:ABC transporter substrate-binding protein [Acuticoccus mangrovi]